MIIDIKEGRGKRDLRAFIHLPAKIHVNHHNWIPPIYIDEWNFFNPKKNTAFLHCNTILFLAYNDNKVVGRVMGIINNKYNNKHGENSVRFCFLETFKNEEIVTELIHAVENWAKGYGVNEIIGPLGFSDKDPQGMLIEGFDEPMVISTNCNYPYMVEFIEDMGFNKRLDLVVYKIDVPKNIPTFYERIHERTIRNNPNLKIVPLKRKKDIKQYIVPVLSLMNDTFGEIYAFTPLSTEEMKEFASRYLMILDPRFIKIVQNEKDEVVAFVLAIPDISEGIQKSKGYVFPFGFYHILRSQKKTKRLSLLLGAVRKDHRRSGIDTMLGISLLKETTKAGLNVIDSHLEMEKNTQVRAEMEKIGGEVYKRYRIYQKTISI